MISAERLLELEPILSDGDPVETTESVAMMLASRIPNENMTSLIALPDRQGGTPIQQIDAQYSELDPSLRRTNQTLLLGIAAHKILQARSLHIPADQVPLIMGGRPVDILKAFTQRQPESGVTLIRELEIPLEEKFSSLMDIEWLEVESSPQFLLAVKNIADAELKNEVYKKDDDANLLNSKVAFLWGGVTSWKPWYLRQEFMDWLQHFRAQAKYHLVLSTLQQLEQGDTMPYAIVKSLQQAVVGIDDMKPQSPAGPEIIT